MIVDIDYLILVINVFIILISNIYFLDIQFLIHKNLHVFSNIKF